MPEPTAVNYPAVMRALKQHYIAFACLCRRAGADINSEPEPIAFPACLVEVSGRTFALTAGHVLKDIEAAKKQGDLFIGWAIGDEGALEGKFDGGVPFDLDNSNYVAYFDKEEGKDYSLIPLSQMHLDLLALNKLWPADEQRWRDDVPDEFDLYMLLGPPKERLSAHSRGGSKGVLRGDNLIRLELETEPPNVLMKPTPRMYFRLPDRESFHISSAEGLSGGPIFGFKIEGTGGRYWLLGVQSMWDSQSRVLAAGYVAPFLAAVEREVQKLQESVSENPEGFETGSSDN
jgi:hypothetical protein